ncbi:hypothetical protein ACFL5K_00350 [Gemmatimonadota bacterium]
MNDTYSSPSPFEDSASALYQEMVKPFSNNGFSRPQRIQYEVITDYDELKTCLNLRYLTSRYVNFIEDNEDHLDIDPYDRYSTFYGAYNLTGWRKTLVGTLRVIGEKENETVSSCIDSLISTARDPRIREIGKRPKKFPVLESFEIPDSSLEGLKKTEEGNNTFYPYEISRLAIRPDFWMYGIDVGLHHLLILDSWLHKPARNDFLIAIHPRSYKRYKTIGFRIVPGTSQVIYKHIKQLAIVMVIDLEEYLNRPRSYRETCESLMPSYRENGFFTRILNKKLVSNSSNSINI